MIREYDTPFLQTCLIDFLVCFALIQMSFSQTNPSVQLKASLDKA